MDTALSLSSLASHYSDSNQRGSPLKAPVYTVSVKDFNHWLDKKKSLKKSQVENPTNVSNNNLRLFKRSKHLESIYKERLAEYSTKKDILNYFSKLEESNQKNDDFVPKISTKSRIIANKLDITNPRSSKVAIIAPYVGVAENKVSPLKRSSQAFIGLSPRKQSTDKLSQSASIVEENIENIAVNADLVSEEIINDNIIVASEQESQIGKEKDLSFGGTLPIDTTLRSMAESYCVTNTSRGRSPSPRVAFNRGDYSSMARSSSASKLKERLSLDESSAKLREKYGISPSPPKLRSRHSSPDIRVGVNESNISKNSAFYTPRVSSPGFSSHHCMSAKDSMKSTYRTPNEPREKNNFKYMNSESIRLMSAKKDSFADRVMESVEKYYTFIGVQKELRKDVSPGRNELIASVGPTSRYSIHDFVGGRSAVSLLGPGQYSNTDISGSKGVRSRSAQGARGFTFSRIPRLSSEPIGTKYQYRSGNKLTKDVKTEGSTIATSSPEGSSKIAAVA